MEAKADISLEDDRSNDLSAIEEKSNNMSAAEEIDLNSDNEFKDELLDSAPKTELRSEPEDIFEDIPEPKEFISDTVSVRPTFEPSVTSPRSQVTLIEHRYLQ